MTSITPDVDRFSYLFDLACQEPDVAPTGLSETEREEVEQIRALLDVVDAAWRATDDEQARVRRLFLQKLAAETPDHPWVQQSFVRTLGDLVQAGGEDLPPLPPASRAQLAMDATPVESLLDPKTRTVVVGQAIRQAGVPLTLVSEFMLWLNRVIAALVPASKSGTQGLIFTRPQGGRRAPKR